MAFAGVLMYLVWAYDVNTSTLLLQGFRSLDSVILLALPLFAGNDYHYDLMIKIALTAAVAVGLNLLVGYAGQVSLGHAAFYAGGAYASALLTQNYEFTPLPAMFTAAVAVGVLVALRRARNRRKAARQDR